MARFGLLAEVAQHRIDAAFEVDLAGADRFLHVLPFFLGAQALELLVQIKNECRPGEAARQARAVGVHPDDVKGVARKAVAKVRVARVGCHRRIPVGAARGVDTVDFAQLAPEGFFELLFALFPRLMEDRGKAEVVAPLPDLGFNKDAKIAREEIFGPVLATIRFTDAADAVAKGNATVYGLAAAVWTRDISKAHRIARAIKAGTVWINTYNLYDPALPFGGFKESGFGRDQGRDALEKYTQTKSVWVNL